MRRNHLLMIVITTLFLQVDSSYLLQAQDLAVRPIAQQVKNLKNSGLALKPISLFSINAARSTEMSSSIKKSVAVTLDMNALAAMKAANEDFVAFSFPYDDKTITLELYKVSILTDDFTVITNQSNGDAISYTPGIYYRGIVKGDDHSVAALSFFDGEMMGIVSSDQYNNINIGKSLSTTAKNYDYVIYSDKNLPAKETSCATVDDPAYAELLKEYATNGAAMRSNNCVRIYYEMDNNLYISNGSSTTTTTNWMTAVHNNVATLYINDAVSTTISQIFIWTTADPYDGTTSSSQLSKFKTNRPTFNGDLGELVGIDVGGLGGVASTTNGMCSSTNKYCYADVDFGYSNVPTYSWTIMVCTHELGHLMGSYHTHSCSWPGGAIDNCYTTEGGCPQGPAPIGGGTIMSYCHLTSNGINFTKGFGPLPSAAIQGAIDAAGCLSSGCTAPCVIPTGLSASSITGSSATLNWLSAPGANSYNIQYRATGSTTWLSSTLNTTSLALSGLSQGTQYEFQVQSICTDGSLTYSASYTFITPIPVCLDNYEPNQTKNTAKAITANTVVYGLIHNSTDIDFFSFSNTTSQKNIKVTLTALPANYDLDFYDPSGNKILSSKFAGTTNESITYNTNIVGKYKVRVYKTTNGSFSATQCYTLLTTTSSTPFRLTEEEIATPASANIYPNPTTGNLTVNYNCNNQSTIDFYVFDVTGKVMQTKTNEAFKGENIYHFDLNGWNNGIYILQIRNGSEINYTKFVIAH
ncbi:MAG: M12 family metallo-peptidase [Chitinophagales bacterium]